MASFALGITLLVTTLGTGSPATPGLRGDSAAIADARAMVETMGGAAIWAQVRMVHFVHEWFPWNRMDSYIEDEVLDVEPGLS